MVHQSEESSNTIQSPKPSCSRPKRQKIVRSILPREKSCIICNHMTSKYDIIIIGLVSQKVLNFSVNNFNKDVVHARCILYQTVKDHFAADIMYHKNCMSTYILKFKRDIRTLLDNDEDVNFCGDEQVKKSLSGNSVNTESPK